MNKININVDMGEGFNVEEKLMPLISSCNISCGAHAGGTSEIKRVVGLAKINAVKIGAHPSYPDRKNFGRISMKITRSELKKSIKNQLLRENKNWFLIFDSNPKNLLQNHGLMPIPPYLKRDSDSMDLEDYQTVFASIDGSIAAPTAGLHFTKKLLDNFKISKDYITLHVGLGTFLPVKSKNIDDHIMHEESFFINNKTLKKIQDAKRNKNRILSIGTTSLRAIESLAIDINQVDKWSKTNLFITEGFDFQFTDCLLTNFHLPKSTLLILISSFLGYELNEML